MDALKKWYKRHDIALTYVAVVVTLSLSLQIYLTLRSL